MIDFDTEYYSENIALSFDKEGCELLIANCLLVPDTDGDWADVQKLLEELTKKLPWWEGRSRDEDDSMDIPSGMFDALEGALNAGKDEETRKYLQMFLMARNEEDEDEGEVDE
jgi:hypothetical protein